MEDHALHEQSSNSIASSIHDSFGDSTDNSHEKGKNASSAMSSNNYSFDDSTMIDTLALDDNRLRK